MGPWNTVQSSKFSVVPSVVLGRYLNRSVGRLVCDGFLCIRVTMAKSFIASSGPCVAAMKVDPTTRRSRAARKAGAERALRESPNCKPRRWGRIGWPRKGSPLAGLQLGDNDRRVLLQT